jgi:hypothetical protein
MHLALCARVFLGFSGRQVVALLMEHNSNSTAAQRAVESQHVNP